MEDEEWNDNSSKTGYTCPYTDDPIHYAEDVVAFHVVAVGPDKNKPSMPVIPGGSELLWCPIFVTLDGWQDINRHVSEAVADVDATPHPRALCVCDYCGSGLIEGELYVKATLGWIIQSKRRPNGHQGGLTFEDRDKDPTVMCLGCAVTMHEEVVAIWPIPVQQSKECEHGTRTRCWRSQCPADAQRGCDITRRTHLSLG